MSRTQAPAQTPALLRGWHDPARAARRLWWKVAIVVNGALLPLVVSGQATVAVLVSLLIAVVARHDGVVRLLGHHTETIPAYRRHQLVYHLGQLHRAMAVAAIGWLLIATIQAGSSYLAVVFTDL